MRRCEEPGCSITLRRDQPGDRCHHHLRGQPGSHDEEYEQRLWRDTDASLRADPSRWVTGSAADNFSSRSRAGDDEPYRPSPRDPPPDDWNDRD